ncbi:LUD domain-containing protein [Motiliproteus sp. MSK22-1]|uniref:LutC/YkgG family protein n=1 Tax=Motiliproteus sp. MSK22-1 TaxID=1897630 RepID=UPI0009760AFC|nr:LUD domain-containing protein [Motiliproteus sp. MSK22-1]OMH38152.1 hypothetical protein BGP75_07745 [Motiliproteus sp. MSK22-1]
MSSSREQIFANIRRGLKRDALQGDALKAVQGRLKEHPSNTIPARSKLPHNEQIQLFIEMVAEASAELIKLDNSSEFPFAVNKFLGENKLTHLVSANSAELSQLDWSVLRDITIERRPAQAGDLVSLTSSFAGIAETGTLMLLSGADSPTTLNFLPDIHLVMLRQSNIVGAYEEAWDKLRSQRAEMPRTVNMITGPSRSADIEQKLQMGAHGPKRLVIFLVAE